MAYRGRTRPFRSTRRRDDTDEDCIQINWGTGLDALLRETLSHIVFHEREPKGRILAYLNCFTKLCSRLQGSTRQLLSRTGFTHQEIFCCLRVGLLHEAIDVRGASLRAMRYFMIDEESVSAFNRVNLPFLVARSLDVVLENKLERLQALRLTRKMLSIHPLSFPSALTRSLISIAREGQSERDILTRSCWATLAEMMLLNPREVTRSGGFSAIFSSVLLGNQSPQISEALVSCIIYHLNYPLNRVYLRQDQDLQFFLSSFTECYTSTPRSLEIESLEQREMRLQASRRMFVSILRSWPGMIHFFSSPSEPSGRGVTHSFRSPRSPSEPSGPGVTHSFRSPSEPSGPGVTHSFRSPSESSQNGIQTVIESLRMPYPEVRRHILDMLYQLLGLPVPPSSIADLDDALTYVESSSHQEHKHLYDGFVCSEAAIFLPQVSRNRVDLFENYLSLILHSLIMFRLPEALTVVITKPKEPSNSARAAILLGHILNLSSRLLPLQIAQKCHSLPDLVNTATSTAFSERDFSYSERNLPFSERNLPFSERNLPFSERNLSTTFSERNLAAAAITFLDRMKLIKKPGSGTISLYLEHVILYCCNSNGPSSSNGLNGLNGLNGPSSRSGSKPLFESCLENESEDKFNNKLRDSLVFNRDPVDWDWDVIMHIVSWPSSSFERLEEDSHRKFLFKVIAYMKPSSHLYSKLDAGEKRGRVITACVCRLLRLLLSIQDPRADELIHVFLTDLMDALTPLTATDNPPVGAILSPTRLISTHSQFYFLLIGIISSYTKGRQLLTRNGYGEVLSQLLSNEINAKLIISSLDYSNQNKFSRPILLQSLKCGNEGSRVYGTNFLRVLLRSGLSDFHEWLLSPLVDLLSDASVRVSSSAMTILDEACDEVKHLESFVKLKIDFSTLGDPGRLLLSRFSGCESGFDHLVSTGCMAQELNYWIAVLCGKYVNMVEHVLNESMTYHFKSAENSYGRRSDRKSEKKAASLPPHLFGQLVKHEKGWKYLQEAACLQGFIQRINAGLEVTENELDIHKLKAALWTVGHVASSERGLQLVKESNIFRDIVSMTANHSVLSIRGTCFYVLGLISSTPDVCTTLRDLGWLVAEYERDDHWLIRKGEESESNLPHQIRGHSLSLSSGGTRVSDWVTHPRLRSFTPLNLLPSTGASSHQLTVSSIRITTPCDHPNQFGDNPNPFGDNPNPFGDHPNPYGEEDNQIIGASSLDTESSFTILKSPSKLSPIVSIDSIVDPKSSRNESILDPESSRNESILDPESSRNESILDPESSRNESSRMKRHLSIQTPESPLTDAYNFAVYVGIQRERVHSLGLTTVDSMIMHPTPSIANSYCSSEEDFDPPQSDPSLSQNTHWTVGDPLHTQPASEDSSCWCKSYRGICLPSSLDMIFKPPERKFVTVPNPLLQPDHTSFDTGLDLHTISSCIICSSSDTMESNQSSKEKTSWRPPTMDRRNTLSIKHLEPLVSASATSSSSVEGMAQSPSHPVMTQVAIRREILRFVTNLSGSVAARSAEQGMLNLKQKYPEEFQDICLYSEVSIQLATYNFRLTSRRFLQELFLDINFEPLKLMARELLNRKLSVGVSSGGEEEAGPLS